MSRTALRVLDQLQDLQGGFGLVVRQEAEIVATEPEVLMDGGLALERGLEVTHATFHAVFGALWEHRVVLEGLLLKPNGVVVLSGGQADEPASARLNARNRVPGSWPWPLSFSYARALQAARLRTWGGDPARIRDAQRAFYHRARCNAAARSGMHTAKLERSVA